MAAESKKEVGGAATVLGESNWKKCVETNQKKKSPVNENA
jgi:hypothetical protein